MRVVLLDAMGTLLALEPPAPRLRAALAERHGIAVGVEEAASAIRAEIAYYRAHHDAASDRARLAALRERCAAVLRDALPPPAARLSPAELVPTLLQALRFTAFPEVPAALRALRAAGLRLVVVSNWDVSLHEALDATGLAPLLDGAVASAEIGAAKPDAAIFRHALGLAGAEPSQALHVGDDVEVDVAGARAAGVAPVLIARGEGPPPPPPGTDVPVVRDLAGVVPLAT